MNEQYYKSMKEVFFVCFVFVFAIAFRLWFITLAPQPFAWDQEEYERYAIKMYWSPNLLAAHTYRSYPYPLFMTLVYKLTAWADHDALFRAQALMDAMTAVFVYILLRKASGKITILPFAGMFLYAVNPFTSGYVGVGLSEVLTTFFITLTLVSGVWYIQKPSVFTGILFGFSAGMAAETRNAAFAWTIIPIVCAVYLAHSWIVKKATVAAIFAGMIVSMIYPLYVNWTTYGQVSATTVDSFYAKEMYNGVILKVLPPFTYIYPVETMQMFWEYYSEYYPERGPQERKAMAEKYFNKAWDLIKKDPVDYIRWRFFKMWYVWQKENIFFYKEPFFEQTRRIVYAGNILLLLTAGIGMVNGAVKAKNKIQRFVWMSIIGTVLYGTLTFSLTHAEYRITIPFYAFLILSSVNGVAVLARKLRIASGIL